MPPRYAYWTILIDGKPTAFRARDKEELLPTVFQLKRKNADVVMKWFARGRLWDTPEQAQWAVKSFEGAREKRGRDWRPGGQHKDPRARFDKPKEHRREKPGAAPYRKLDPATTSYRPPGSTGGRPDARPLPSKSGWHGKPNTRPANQRPWSDKPKSPSTNQPWSGRPPRNAQRPWQNKGPQGERSAQRPWHAKPPDRRKWPPRGGAGQGAKRVESSSRPPVPPKRDDDEE